MITHVCFQVGVSRPRLNTDFGIRYDDSHELPGIAGDVARFDDPHRRIHRFKVITGEAQSYLRHAPLKYNAIKILYTHLTMLGRGIRTLMQAVELQRAPLVAEGVREDAAVGMRLDEAGCRAPRQAAARPLRCVDVAMPVRCWLSIRHIRVISAYTSFLRLSKVEVIYAVK